ncbi:hypothetical protein [Soonwooa sp.]|uniref:hypothetical protein n=1 Tax=Soonwooa sp. TaxID=1938592 RepID=UPI0026138E8E|nr:hypothetical protein [Soonwooa sp.]
MKKLLFSLILISAATQINAQVERRGGSADRSRSGSDNMGTTMQRGTLGTTSLAPTQNDRMRSAPSQMQTMSNWQGMNNEERQEMMKNMNPRERSQFMQNVKQDIFLDELNIPEASQAEFKEIFDQYTASQKQIKDKFKGTVNIDKLSNDEAKQKLDDSFEIGKQLLDNRKVYADKFLKILTPQQVLKLFQTEGKVRDKIMDKKYGGK